MYAKVIFCLLLIISTGIKPSNAQFHKTIITEGDSSSVIIANNLRINEGFNTLAIEKLLSYFDKRWGMEKTTDSVQRLVNNYIKQGTKFSCSDQRVMSTLSMIYISTKGNNSPVVFSYGDIAIENGISYLMFNALVEKLMSYEKDSRLLRGELTTMCLQLKKVTRELEPYKKTSKAAATVLANIYNGRTDFGKDAKIIKDGYGRLKDSLASYGYILGLLYELNFNYKEAEEYFKDAAYNNKQNTTYQLAVAENCRKRNKHQESLEYYNKVRSICLKQAEPVCADLFYAYVGAGKIYQRSGLFSDASTNFDSAYRCLQYSKAIPDINPAYYFDALANYYFELGQFSKSRVEVRKLLQQLKKETDCSLLFPTANPYITLGLIYHMQWDIDSSLFYFHLGLKKEIKRGIPNNPAVAEACNGIASNFLVRKRFDSAIFLFKGSYRIDTAVFGKESVAAASDLINLGVAYTRKGDSLLDTQAQLAMTFYDSAEANYVKAWNIDSTLLPAGHPELAIIKGNLGEIYTKKKDFLKAISCNEQALRVYKNYYGQKHPLVALALNNQGITRLEQYRYFSATSNAGSWPDSLEISLSLLNLASKTMHSFFDSAHAFSKIVFRNIATALLYKGIDLKDQDSAWSLYRECIIYALAADDTTTTVFAYGKVGMLFKKNKQCDSALVYNKTAISLIDPLDLLKKSDDISKALLEFKDAILAGSLARIYYSIIKCLADFGNTTDGIEIIGGLKRYATKGNDPEFFEILKSDGLLN